MIGILVPLLLNMSYEDFYKTYKEAEALFFAGKYEKAEKIYKRLLRDGKKYGFDKEIRYRIAECKFNSEKYDDAYKDFRKLYEDKDVNRRLKYLKGEAMYAISVYFTNFRDPKEAKQVLVELQKYPYYKNSNRTRMLLGVLDYREHRYDEAVEKLKDIKDIPEAQFYYARSLALLRRPLEAITVYKQLLERYKNTPREPFIAYAMIEANFIYGDYKGTATMAKDFIERYHGSKFSDWVQYYWGVSLYRMRQFESAIEKLTLVSKKKDFEFANLAAYFAGNAEIEWGHKYEKEGKKKEAIAKFNEAIKYYETALSKASDRDIYNTSFIRLMESHFFVGDTVKSYTMADQLLNMEFPPQEAGIGEYSRGAIDYALGKYYSAAKNFELVIENYPETFLRRPSMAMEMLSLVRDRKFEEALLKGNIYYSEMREDQVSMTTKDTTFDLWKGWYVYGLAEAHYYAGAYPEAEVRYNINVQMQLTRDLVILSRLGLGWVAYHQKRYDDALAHFNSIEQAVRFKGDTSLLIALYLGRGVVKFNKGLYMDAFRDFAVAAVFVPRPEAAEAIYFQGLAALALKSYGDAVKLWERVVNEFPEHPRAAEAAYRAADIYIKAGQVDKAIALLEWVIEHFPGSPITPQAMYALGRAYAMKKDFDKAIQIYEKFLFLYPDHELASAVKDRVQDYYLLAITSEGDTAKLQQFVEKYSSSPKAAEALFYQAAKAYQDGEELKAAELFFKMANEFPNSKKAPEALYTAGALYIKNKKYESAIQALKKYKDFFPDGAKIEDVYNYLITAYLATNDYGKAIESGKEMLQKFPNTKYKPRVLFNIGWAYTQMGNSREAIKYLQQARTLYEQEGNSQMVAQIDAILQSLPK